MLCRLRRVKSSLCHEVKTTSHFAAIGEKRVADADLQYSIIDWTKEPLTLSVCTLDV